MKKVPETKEEWQEPPLLAGPDDPAVIANYADAVKVFNDPRFLSHLTFADRTSPVQCPWLKFKGFFSAHRNRRVMQKARGLISLAAQFSSFQSQTRSHKHILKSITSHLEKINKETASLPERFFSKIPDGVPVDWMDSVIKPYLEHINKKLMGWPEGTPYDFIREPEATSDFFNQNLSASPEQVEKLERFIETVKKARQSPKIRETDGLVRNLGPSSPLPEPENLANLLMIYIASKHSLPRFISGSLLLLLKEPGLLGQLRKNPGLLPSAIDEFIRFITPQPVALRRLVEDVPICGVTLRAGQRVRINLAKANRDPAFFKEPDKIDISRRTNPHLSFGNGSHFCVGQLYTRMVVRNFLSGFIHSGNQKSFHLVSHTPDQHGNALAPVTLVIQTRKLS